MPRGQHWDNIDTVCAGTRPFNAWWCFLLGVRMFFLPFFPHSFFPLPVAAWIPVCVTGLNRKFSTSHRQPAWTSLSLIFFLLAGLKDAEFWITDLLVIQNQEGQRQKEKKLWISWDKSCYAQLPNHKNSLDDWILPSRETCTNHHSACNF